VRRESLWRHCIYITRVANALPAKNGVGRKKSSGLMFTRRLLGILFQADAFRHCCEATARGGNSRKAQRSVHLASGNITLAGNS